MLKVLRYIDDDIPTEFKGDRYLVLSEDDEFWQVLLISQYDTDTEDEPVFVWSGLHIDVTRLYKPGNTSYVEDHEWFSTTE